ncbi:MULTISPECIES: YihY/virulence factor BrkB family protein [Chryseobacterium]|jgi:membrane protein|uniref:Membrane protein n=1 Tax=Chryseobacterium rhizosphaerae TaxID=395937 RepID=A0AAE4C2I6_9FLAO|nr:MULTISPECIES: YihY/virulence factor BrkB family protein [Chryseobacterium]MBL3546041.1 YihY/virulence factor BrkB family protein [Chryseobacterium sp. KMC2]MDR6525827.1 membrane protein [Chryseobacterium rhizosphaerae]MDR6544987.1 membrane protein [Chryseobacterium rhizosphaerae]REC73321.1 YihY/virulence factor BrkB family protein [Chryseobacterium rhizosphaerae]SMC62144.1 membrane protein [Chryseobacterium sp. YR221]
MSIKVPRFILKVQEFFDDIHIPVLGISLWQMFQIYISGIFKGKIGRKAAAISWSFTISLFPFLLFLLSVLPYMPHYDKLQFYIFEVLMHNVFPSNMEGDVRGYIETNIIPNMKGISNLTIVLALVFATNGTFSLINGFNENADEKLSDVKEFILSFFITIGFITIVFLALFGVYYVEVVMKLFTPAYDVTWLVDNLSRIIGFVSFPLFYFILLTLFYWLGTVKITRFRQAVPGAVLTTILFVLTTYIFAIYVKDIARYNVLYGSIGSMILLMVWVNVNVYLLLFGNELNMAIRKLRIEKLLSDEIQKEAAHYHTQITEPDFENNKEHQWKLENRKKD